MKNNPKLEVKITFDFNSIINRKENPLKLFNNCK